MVRTGDPLGADGAGHRLDFGRYQGWTLGDVAKRDPDYLAWLRRHQSGARSATPSTSCCGTPGEGNGRAVAAPTARC